MSEKLLQLRQELVEDIAALKMQRLRLDAQILKCETAVVEIDVMIHHPTVLPEEGSNPPEPELELTVISMVRAILPSFKGNTFWYSDIKAAVLKAHPEHEQKIKRGIHPACKVLKDNNEIISVTGGFKLPEDCK